MEIAVLSQICSKIHDLNTETTELLVKTLCNCNDRFACFDICKILLDILRGKPLQETCSLILKQIRKETLGSVEALVMLSTLLDESDSFLRVELSETTIALLREIINNNSDTTVSQLLTHSVLSIMKWIRFFSFSETSSMIFSNSSHVIKRRWLQTAISVIQNPPSELYKQELTTMILTSLNDSPTLLSLFDDHSSDSDHSLIPLLGINEETVYMNANISALVCSSLVEGSREDIPDWILLRDCEKDRNDVISAALGTDETLVLVMLVSLKSVSCGNSYVRKLLSPGRIFFTLQSHLSVSATSELLIDLLSSSDLSPSLLSVLLSVLKTTSSTNSPFLIPLFSDLNARLRRAAVGIPFSIQPIIARINTWLVGSTS